MRKLIVVASIVAVAAVGAGAWVALRPAPSATAAAQHPKAKAFLLDERSPEMRARIIEAVAGSREAAAHLADMYSKCPGFRLTGADLERCYADSQYWVDIASENGGATGISYRVVDLLSTGTCRDAHRVAFWYERLKATEYPQLYMRSLAESVEEAKRKCAW